MIVTDDGFSEIDPPRVEEGDVVVYYDSRGEPLHSGIIIGQCCPVKTRTESAG